MNYHKIANQPIYNRNMITPNSNKPKNNQNYNDAAFIVNGNIYQNFNNSKEEQGYSFSKGIYNIDNNLEKSYHSPCDSGNIYNQKNNNQGQKNHINSNNNIIIKDYQKNNREEGYYYKSGNYASIYNQNNYNVMNPQNNKNHQKSENKLNKDRIEIANDNNQFKITTVTKNQPNYINNQSFQIPRKMMGQMIEGNYQNNQCNIHQTKNNSQFINPQYKSSISQKLNSTNQNNYNFYKGSKPIASIQVCEKKSETKKFLDDLVDPNIYQTIYKINNN